MRRIAAKLTLFLLFALLGKYGTAAASDDAVTLQEAVDRALSSNHLLKAASAREGAAGAAVAAARTRFLPRVYLESGAAISNTPSRVFMMKLDEARISPASDFAPDALNHPSPRGDFRSAVTLEQPLLDFSIGTAVEVAKKDAESADLTLQMQREDVALRVYQAYLEVRRARAMQAVAQQAVADAAEHRRVAAAKARNGNGLKSDELRTETELSEAQQRLITAENDLVLARLKLNLVVGGEDGAPLDIAGEPALPAPKGSTADLVQVAYGNRPDLKEAGTAVDKGDLALRQARDAYLPTVYAGASYQVNDRDVPLGWDNDSWSAGINLRWELFDGTRRSQDKKRARFLKVAATELLQDRRREVALQVTESVLRRNEAMKRVESARAALSAADEGMRLVRKRFENGLSALVELLDAEAALNRARGNLVEVENGCLLATARVYYTSGVLLKEVLK